MPRKSIRVAAAAIFDGRGRVLLSQRRSDSHQGGLWEFPGGKLEPGESPEQALLRELDEELGIRPRCYRPLISLRHDYDDLSVTLEVYRVDAFDGMPQGLEGQPLEWVPTGRLREYPMPAADIPVVRALELPPELLITGGWQHEREFVSRLAGALQRGVRLVQLRVPDADPLRLRRLAELVLPLCREADALLQLNADLQTAAALPCDGIHLNRHRLMSLNERPTVCAGLLSASCHDLQEIEQAHRIGCDYLLLSPVRPTASHPGAPVLGWSGFSALAKACRIPVYALGGVGPEDLERAFVAGAQGVAGISAYW